MAAYWISPKNEVINVPTVHIDTVITNPETFGLTKEGIQKIYDSYGEPLGSEGKAREEIILDLVRKGWIRIRQYRNQGWSVNVGKLSKKLKIIFLIGQQKLHRWDCLVLRKEICIHQ